MNYSKMDSNQEPKSEDVFAAIGNEVRIDILRSFLEVNPSGGGIVSFSELFDRVPVSSSSQFAYHVDILEGIFLKKVDGGYSLTLAGERIVRAILAGTFHERASFERVEIDGVCAECGSTTLSAERTDLDLVLRCRSCNTPVVTYDLLPAETIGRTSFEILESCDRRVHQAYATALRGTCTLCGGKTDQEVTEAAPNRPRDIYCLIECRQCGYPVHAPLSVSLCYHPEVISFYWKHGVNILQVPFWKIHRYLSEWSVDLLSEDPFWAQVTVRYTGEEISIELDGGFSDIELTPVTRFE